MAEYWLRPKARSDIDAIWDYTIKTWGVQQARSYITGLRDVCTELAETPDLGKRRDELYKGLRVYPSGKHVVFYISVGFAFVPVTACSQQVQVQSIVII